MGNNNKVIAACLLAAVVLGSLAVYNYTSGANTTETPVIEADGAPPQNLDAYTVIVENTTYLCIEHDSATSERGYYGLSCTPLDETGASESELT